MSISVCTSCVARLRLTQSSTALPAVTRISFSPFSSSAIHQNVVAKKKVNVKGASAPKLRESRSARIKKKTRTATRPPAVGARKAERRRIVLSNTNALEVAGLEKLSVENMDDEGKIGHVLSLDGPLLDQLREGKAFKTTQNWGLFRTPSTLIRKESVEIGKDIREILESGSTKHKLIVGEKASGKSVQLLQAMSLGYLNKWVVINVPDCQEYVTNQSPYTPATKAEERVEQLYHQPRLASDLLSRAVHSSSDILSKMSLVHNHGKSINTKKTKTVKDLAMLGVEDYHIAPQIWAAFWKEIAVPAEGANDKSKRPQVLIAIDGVNFWMGDTKYRSADYKIIHAHQFTLIKQFVDLLFSKTQNPLPNGGMVLACTTKSNHPTLPAFDLLVRQVEARRSGLSITDSKFPLNEPYMKQRDQKVFDLVQGIEYTALTQLQGLTRPESKGLLEYFARSGILKEQVTDEQVAEKWSMSGGGIVGEMCKLGARLRTGIFETGRREGVKMRT